jgi:SAM-dependent methyltransferase
VTRVVFQDPVMALEEVIRRLEPRWAGPCPGETTFYGYEPLPLQQFLPGLVVCEQATVGRRFLDVGCGIGRAMLIAQLMGWDVTGLERHRPYIEAGRELVPEATFIAGEADDFAGYGGFDVVYSYRLCVNDEDQDQLERRILDRMRPGAIAFFGHRTLKTPMPGEPLGANCWRV